MISEHPAAASTTSRPPRPVPNFDLIDELAETFRRKICDEAAVWDVNFDAGPGLVVSVSDAARVIGRLVSEWPVAQGVPAGA